MVDSCMAVDLTNRPVLSLDAPEPGDLDFAAGAVVPPQEKPPNG